MLPATAKPYLVRALYEWCMAEGHTPYILVTTGYPGVRFPEGYDKDGRLTLNIGTRAVQDLDLGPDRVRFRARFGGQFHQVEVPLTALLAIFAAETHEGMVFEEPSAPPAAATAAEEPAPPPPAEPEPPRGGEPTHLRLVK